MFGTILVKIGFGDLNFNKVTDQERALELAEQKKQRIRDQVKRSGNEDSSPYTRGPASTPKLPVPAPAMSPSLIDVSKPKPEQKQPRRVLPPQSQRPAFYSQNRSKQQPAMAISSRVERPESEDSQASSTAPANRSLTLDPLGLTNLIEAGTATVKKTSRPMASETIQCQTPSTTTLISDAELDAQASKVAKVPFSCGNKVEGGPITLVDSFDTQKQDVGGQDKLKTAAAVTGTEVLVAGRDGGNDLKHIDSDDETYNDLADEIGSGFGELAMVDPVPLDDFDYGLM